MTSDQFRAAAAALALSHERCAMLMGYYRRQGRRWAAGTAEIPAPVAVLIDLAVAGRVVLPELAERLAAHLDAPPPAPDPPAPKPRRRKTRTPPNRPDGDSPWTGLRPAVRLRLATAVDHVRRTGTLRRADIMAAGEVSEVQATADIAMIRARMPGLIRRDTVRKCYVLTSPADAQRS